MTVTGHSDSPPVLTLTDDDRSATPQLSRDEQLKAHVRSKISQLQRAYLERDSSAAVASLAKLRRAVNASAGSDPAIWFETLDGVPSALLGSSDAPSAYEHAIHASVTLYAIHQQSQRVRMHRTGYRLGTSVRLLADRVSTDQLKNTSPVLRRFHALGTASSVPETLQHLRGLVTQFRAEEIPLEYGRLAQDLRRLQNPRTAASVRLQWGRDYHRITTDLSSTTDSALEPRQSDDVPDAGSQDSSTGDSE